MSAFSVGFQVEVGPVKVDVAGTESLHSEALNGQFESC